MKKESTDPDDGLRAEYDLTRGKYYRRATTGTNLVLIEPDLAEVLPDGDSVNRALRVLAAAAACETETRTVSNRAVSGRATRVAVQPRAAG
jgi:hypothetical protein